MSSGPGSPWIQVEHPRQALALAARNFYGNVDRRLCLTGITGTNGKTTTAFLIDAILRAAGKTTSLIGTIEYRLAGELRTAVNTTPESLDLYRIFDETERAGGTHVTMEVSSHALALGRVYGVRFHTAVFTNLTRDHLDFHGTMEDYFAAKQQLFQSPHWAVINADDEYGRRIELGPKTRRLTYGFSESDLRASRPKSSAPLKFNVTHEGQTIEINSPLIGRINAYNILAACGAALTYGLDWETIVRGVGSMQHRAGALRASG